MPLWINNVLMAVTVAMKRSSRESALRASGIVKSRSALLDTAASGGCVSVALDMSGTLVLKRIIVYSPPYKSTTHFDANVYQVGSPFSYPCRCTSKLFSGESHP